MELEFGGGTKESKGWREQSYVQRGRKLEMKKENQRVVGI